jgi:hypothetical protein
LALKNTSFRHSVKGLEGSWSQEFLLFNPGWKLASNLAVFPLEGYNIFRVCPYVKKEMVIFAGLGFSRCAGSFSCGER